MNDPREPLPGESTPDRVPSVLDIRYPDGGIRFKITRFCSANGTEWIRHGPYWMFHPDGGVAVEGQYQDGLETGNWRDYYRNGQLASEGCFVNGKQHGYWRFWLRDGTELNPIEFDEGKEVSPAQPS